MFGVKSFTLSSFTVRTFPSIRDHKFCLVSNIQLHVIISLVVFCFKVMSSNVTDLNCFNSLFSYEVILCVTHLTC